MKTAHLFSLFIALVMACAIAPAPAHAQGEPQNPSLGLVAKSSNANIGSAAATEGSTVYSGDYLNTSDNGSLLVRIGGLSFELEASSAAHVYRTPYGAIAELNRGTIIYNTPGTRENLVIVASDVRVTPVLLMADIGRVTIDDPCNITVYSQHGQVNVQAGSESRLVEQGKAYRVRAVDEISYRKSLSPDDDDYHKYHDHRPCAPVEMVKGHSPIAAAHSRFALASAALIGGATSIGIWKALESPDRP